MERSYPIFRLSRNYTSYTLQKNDRGGDRELEPISGKIESSKRKMLVNENRSARIFNKEMFGVKNMIQILF